MPGKVLAQYYPAHPSRAVENCTSDRDPGKKGTCYVTYRTLNKTSDEVILRENAFFRIFISTRNYIGEKGMKYVITSFNS